MPIKIPDAVQCGAWSAGWMPKNRTGISATARVVRTDVIIHCLRQKQQLRAIVTSDVRHA